VSEAIEIVAHRGASFDEPEHSLAAYLLAARQGADAVECDVRLTRDGELVCHHDRRIDRTSSGKGVVSTSTLDDLTRHDFSGGRAGDDPDLHVARAKVLTLRELIETMLEASPRMKFAIETKHPVRYHRHVEIALIELLDQYRLLPGEGEPSRVRLMSFSRSAVLRMQDLAPHTPTVFLMDPVWWPYRDGSLPPGVPITGPSIEYVRKYPDYVERVHERGGKVHVWVVDEGPDIDLCRYLNVDAIISNRPAHVRERLGR
jgi:glycerophosphoryl diester phosphodiesterase